MIIDVVTYNGEKELFDLRYHILKNYVDKFIVVEFDKTFSGKDKNATFLDIEKEYPKVEYLFVKEYIYNKYHDLAISSPNTEYGKGAEHWIREFCQKESIKDCLVGLQDDDLVFIGDCDEIWNPKVLEWKNDYGVGKLKLLVYTYFLDNRSDENFAGTIFGQYKFIKDEVLNHLRTQSRPSIAPYGWHFTSMGGLEEVRRKLESSYTADSYYTPEVKDKLEERFGKSDYMGRGFKFWIDETDWPEYLKLNKEKYGQMFYRNPSV